MHPSMPLHSLPYYTSLGYYQTGIPVHTLQLLCTLLQRAMEAQIQQGYHACKIQAYTWPAICMCMWTLLTQLLQ